MANATPEAAPGESARLVRIFVSSPSDVMAERERVDRVVARLNGELAGSIKLETIRWEHAYYSASTTFQAQIPKSSETDLVLCILWKRLGSELPPEFRRADGSTYGSGTEFEFEDAMIAARVSGVPDILVYRKTARIFLEAGDDSRLELERAQLKALEGFWRRWFQSEQGHFTAGYQNFETTDDFEALIEQHLRQWLERKRRTGKAVVRWNTALKGSPFRGLEPFDESHAEVFFGRRRTVEQARERLNLAAGRGFPFLLVLGSSGVGKSSLTRAGLVPRLTAPGAVLEVDLWRRCVLRPSEAGDQPLLGLARALFDPGTLPELGAGDYRTPEELAELFRANPAGAALPLRRALERWAATVGAAEEYGRSLAARLVLVIDQLEEVFQLSAEARQRYLATLDALIDSGLVWVVATLRSDFYPLLQGEPLLMALKEKGAQLDLQPPGRAEIAEIIEGPARLAGLSFETRAGDGESLAAELERAVADPSALALLEFTLDELFNRRDAENRLTFAAYEALGGLAGAVERRAEAVYAGLPAEAQAELPALLRELVTVRGGDGPAVAARAALRDRAGASPARGGLIDAFVQARLLVVSGGGDGTPTVVRCAHEALVSNWPRAGELIEADRDLLRIRARVETAAAEWGEAGRDDSFLLAPGRALAEAEELLVRAGPLDDTTQAYVERSSSQDRARRERRLRRIRAIAIGMGCLALLAAGFGWYALDRSRAAERNFNIAVDAADSLVLDVSRRLRSLSGVRAEEVREILQQAEAVFTRLLTEAGETPLLRHRQAVMLMTFAETHTSMGDGRAAKERVSAAEGIMERLVARDPDNARWRRDLAVTRFMKGDVLRAEGDNDGALTAYRSSVGDLETLATRQADNPAAQRDLATATAALVDLLRAKGDAAGADAMARRTLAVSEALVAKIPDDPSAVRLLSMSHNLIGDLAAEKGDPATALESYRKALAIREQLVAKDPRQSEWQRALTVAQIKVGDTLGQQGDWKAALPAFRAALAIRERLAQQDPENAGFQRDLSASLDRIGESLTALGEPVEAVAAFRRSLAIREALTARDPANAVWLRDLYVSYTYLAKALPAEAVTWLERALDLAQRLERLSPTSPQAQADLTWVRERLERARGGAQ